MVTYFIGMLHVTLEFPLDIRTFSGIGGELWGRVFGSPSAPLIAAPT